MQAVQTVLSIAARCFMFVKLWNGVVKVSNGSVAFLLQESCLLIVALRVLTVVAFHVAVSVHLVTLSWESYAGGHCGMLTAPVCSLELNDFFVGCPTLKSPLTSLCSC